MSLLDIFKNKKGEDKFVKKQKEKDKAKKTETAAEKEDVKKTKTEFSGFSATILEKPHITEKNTVLNEKNAYVFKINPKASKIMVKRAIKETYGMMPEKVNIVYAPAKKRFVRGKYGTKSGFKKAIVYLKEGDKIEIS
ncbi:50S ribosomal protein L23 [Patescibacteria group bacterium]|nr:50S ribosomal protein L23 [Patescibacteria group bacterium]